MRHAGQRAHHGSPHADAVSCRRDISLDTANTSVRPDGAIPGRSAVTRSSRAHSQELVNAELNAELDDAHSEIDALESALRTNRVISTAVGILMERHRTDSQHALSLLGEAHHRENRQLVDIAADVVSSSRARSTTDAHAADPRPQRRPDAANQGRHLDVVAWDGGGHFWMTTRRHDDVLIIALHGELDFAEQDQFTARAVDALTCRQVSMLVLDLADLTFLAASGLSALTRLRTMADRRSLPLALRNIPSHVQRVLELWGMRGYLDTAG